MTELTERRISVCFTKRDLEDLYYLRRTLGESQSGVIRRALALLHQETKTKETRTWPCSNQP